MTEPNEPLGLLDPARGAASAARVGLGDRADREPDSWVQAVARAAGTVRSNPDAPIPTWSVADHHVRRTSERRGRSTSTRWSAPARGRTCVTSRPCWWSSRVRRPPARRRAAGAPVGGEPGADGARAPHRAGAHRRVGALRRAPPTPGLRGLAVEATVVRDGAADQRAPATLERLRDAVPDLSDADAAAHTALRALGRARRAERASAR
ncbi:MAG: hypothetical protein R3F59_28010 [Myxococcota bacterium]